MRKWLTALAVVLAATFVARSDILSPVPNTFVNGEVADANEVNANFASIVAGVNANAATNGANSDITSLTGLTTPLSYTLGGSSMYLGGTSAGTGNAQTIASTTPTGFTLVTGKQVTFIAGNSNTSTTTLNVATTGVKNIYKATALGPVALTGGEIVANNIVTVVYDGTQYQLLSTDAAASEPPGTIKDYIGLTAPSGYLFAYGQTVSRTTYATLFGVMTLTSAASTTNGSKIVTGISSTTNLAAGMFIGGNNVSCNETIATVDSATQITMTTNNASATGATTLNFSSVPLGDCSTTFTIPDMRGRIAPGRDNMGGSAASRITVAGTGCLATTLGTTCGTQTTTLVQAHLPNVDFTVSANGKVNNVAAGADSTVAVSAGSSVGALFSQEVSGTAASGGSDTPFSRLMPLQIVNKIIKF